MSVVARPGRIEHRDAAEEVSHAPPATEVEQTDLLEAESHATNRWFGIGALALGIAGIGVITTQPSLVLIAAIGGWYALYARIGRVRDPSLRLTRDVSESTGHPGDEITVTVRIENLGSRPIADLRVVDGVPDTVAVVDGTPRHATALAPGTEAQFRYTIEARRGYHRFDPTTVVLRDIAGSTERVYRADVPSELHVQPDPTPLPPLTLRELTRSVTGRVETRRAGPGVEFHSTREYRPGDPRSQIDWNRLARTGELTTVEFRQERAATVVVIVDVRSEAFVSRPGGRSPAAADGLDAAVRIFFSLLDVGDRVGLATLGPDPLWLPPGLGVDHRSTAQLLFGSHPALAPRPPSERIAVTRARRSIRRHLPSEAQVVFVSPLADGSAERFAVGLEARGHPVTILSPDPSGFDTDGNLLRSLERHLRVGRLRDRGIRVVEWDDERSLIAAIEEGAYRW